MPFSNYIYEYYDGISSGNITVGKWVRLLYEYIVKGLQEGLFTFNAKKANKAIRFIENLSIALRIEDRFQDRRQEPQRLDRKSVV